MRPIHAPAIAAITLATGFAFALPIDQPADGPHLHQDCSHAHHPTAPGVELVHACWPTDDGTLTGQLVPLETLDEETVALRRFMADRNLARGILPERIDIVFVGDGYTASEQALFQSDVDAIEADLFQYEPFITYKPFFRVQRVEVISNESGVDNDPSQGVSRDTALDMSYWCSGIERLLCVNVSKALQAAGAGVITDVDQVVAISNSTKYGGAGYPSSDVGTSAGRNSAATQIVIHELGHSLGNLADEYTYGGPTNYTGGEPGTANVSIYNESEQITQERKWYRWMGASFPVFDNPVGTYEGGQYSVNGIYRPSNNSMMRSLGRRFNAVSAEQLIKEFYREVRPIEDSTPEDAELTVSDSIFCAPVQPDGHDLTIVWELNGSPIPAATDQTTLDLSTLGLDDAENIITATVVDPTPWVRDPSIREQFLTERRTWTINPCERLADIDGNGELTFFDVSSFVLAFQIQDPVGDFNNDGLFNFFDFVDFINEFTNPCGN